LSGIQSESKTGGRWERPFFGGDPNDAKAPTMCPNSLRQLPSVSALLEHRGVSPLLGGRRRSWMTRLAQGVVAALRRELGEGRAPVSGGRPELLAEAVRRLLAERERLLRPALQRVLNGTGVVVHTNLGRSRWPERALEWTRAATQNYCDLEFDLTTGTRGHRGRKVERKAALLTGAEDALVVNNNAAAVWLAVRGCTGGGKLVLSRGEIVAIGGSFRMDEILAETHCRLIEVGTTNRTSRRDYERVLEPGATLLKVHRSNFAMQGFTEEVSLTELAALSRETSCTLIYDAGSGALYPYDRLGLPPEEGTLAGDIAGGADLVTCSGDKLLGGCQAGLILGRAKLIERLRRHPMRRAFRVGKTTLAALDAVLTLYLEAEERPSLPTLESVAVEVTELDARAERLADLLRPAAPAAWSCRITAESASVGGGAFAAAELPSRQLLWEGPADDLERVHAALRNQDPPLVARKNQDGLAVDLRTIAADELELVAAAFREAWRGA
jgi:L-seryl-tRNA(Ser) seleniumtransferase